MGTDSRFVHLIWQNEELAKMVQGGVPFPMLSDAGGKVGAVYGVYDEDAGVDIRGRFIIDPDFVIRAKVLTPKVGRNPDGLIQVKAFQHVRATSSATRTLPMGHTKMISRVSRMALAPSRRIAMRKWQKPLPTARRSCAAGWARAHIRAWPSAASRRSSPKSLRLTKP
jgi:hypothetical protein